MVQDNERSQGAIEVALIWRVRRAKGVTVVFVGLGVRIFRVVRQNRKIW